MRLAVQRQKFTLGQTVITRGALLALQSNVEQDEAARERVSLLAVELIARHALGDWGDVCPEDWKANDAAVDLGGLRILSSYTLYDKSQVWIITEADRSVTTILLPEEY